MSVQRRLAAILAADVAGYSRLMGEDEEGTLAALTAHRTELIEPCIAEHNGRVVKTTGDGLLAEFASVVNAVRCAIAWQKGITARTAQEPANCRIEFRIGVNLGDVIVQDGDIYGDGVNVAARLEGLAAPGGVVVSGSVHEQVRSWLDVTFADLGPQEVKNIAAPVHAYNVEPPASDAVGRPALGPSAIAVLPFENRSGDSEQDYFADGLTEDIITALSLWRSFPVIARNSVFAFKGTSPDVRRVGQELGARYIIEGSVRRSSDRVRVTAQLIDAETGHHVWAERYDRAIDDFFELQDEIADRIAAIIEPALAKAERKRIGAKRPSDLAAWEYCLRGFDHPGGYTPEDFAQAREMFAAALALDPDYARAYAGIAYSHCRDFRFGSADDRDETCRAAFVAARRAVAIDNTDSQSHIMLSRAYSLVGDGESMIAEGRRAIELNPHDTDALVMTGAFLAFWGGAEEGAALIERGLELNPLDPRAFNFMSHLCIAYLVLGEYETAARWGREATRRNPDFFDAHINLASALGYLGRGEEAQKLLTRFEDSAIQYVSGQVWIRQDVTDVLLEGLRKAGLSDG